jgi:hypothetical protein
MQVQSTPQGRGAVLRDLEGSGLSMAEFCRRRGLAYATVAAWRGAARRRRRGFVEVEAADEAGDEPGAVSRAQSGGSGRGLCAELVLPGGVVLRVYQSNGTGGGA